MKWQSWMPARCKPAPKCAAGIQIWIPYEWECCLERRGVRQDSAPPFPSPVGWRQGHNGARRPSWTCTPLATCAGSAVLFASSHSTVTFYIVIFGPPTIWTDETHPTHSALCLHRVCIKVGSLVLQFTDLFIYIFCNLEVVKKYLACSYTLVVSFNYEDTALLVRWFPQNRNFGYHFIPAAKKLDFALV